MGACPSLPHGYFTTVITLPATRYARDSAFRACSPGQEQEHYDKEQEERQQEQNEENQEHLEVCQGYVELWSGLGPATEELRVQYFVRVKI